MHPVEALLQICQSTYQGREVAWFGGDDWDAPGWRAFALCGRGALLCVGAPPRLTKALALADLQWISWQLDNRGIAWAEYQPPDGWPGRQYGADPEACGPGSFFGMDVPEAEADAFCQRIANAIKTGAYTSGARCNDCVEETKHPALQRL